MKNSKLLLNMLAFAISALFLTSCNTVTEPTPVENPTFIKSEWKKIYDKSFIDLAIIISDTTLPKQETKLHTPPTNEPNIKLLKNETDVDLKGKPLRYVAIGGSFTAGVRDGGLFTDAQQTSYPNMIARQMKLAQFRQPLFNDKEFNGYGYKVPTNRNPSGTNIIKYNVVQNNLAIVSKDNDDVVLSQYDGEFDNWGVPFLTQYGGINTYNDDKTGIYKSAKYYLPFLKRYKLPTQQSQNSLFGLLQNSKADFYTFELGIQDCINLALSGGESDFYHPVNGFDIVDDLPSSSYLTFIRYITKKIGSKGCISNVPNILDFPYFKQVTFAQVQKGLNSNYVYVASTELPKIGTPISPENILVLPTETIDSLLNSKIESKLKKGISETSPLLITNLLSQKQESIKSMQENFNWAILETRRKYAFALVDLNTLYQKILKNEYITDDGIRVDSSFPNGNFFSTDGINPTTFGQAVIANEFIRTINQFYKTDIQFIKTAEYLKK